MKHCFERIMCWTERCLHRQEKHPRAAALKCAAWSLLAACKGRCACPTNDGWITLYTKWGRCVPVEPNTRRIPLIPPQGHIRLDIKKALQQFPQVKRLGLVFFMGVGDYFYATPFIKLLKKQFPQVALDAYVSDQFDSNNSPLVADCLRCNPNIENVYMYSGKRCAANWKNYDWSACYKTAPADTLLLPMVYEYHEGILSRTQTLCDTFCLPVPDINPVPCLDDYPVTPAVEKWLGQIPADKKIVFLQLSNRSSGFCYAQGDELIKGLWARGYFVITVEPTELAADNLLKIDTHQHAITETIALLQQLRVRGARVEMLTTFSCFNSVAGGLDIPVLSMQCSYHPSIASVMFSNMFLITPYLYHNVSADRQFVAPPEAVQKKGEFYYFSAAYVLRCFERSSEAWFRK